MIVELYEVPTESAKDCKQLSQREQQLVIEHLHYVRRIARRFYRQYRGCGIDLDDCTSAGYIGLCRAAQRFDEKVGSDFKIFSFLRIRGAMFDLLRGQGTVGRGMYKTIQQGSRGSAAGEAAGEAGEGTGEGTGEIRQKIPFAVAHTGAQLRQLSQVIEQVGIKIHVQSACETVDISYLEEFCPEKFAQQSDMRRYLERLLSELPEAQREVLLLRYYQDYSYPEMGQRLQGATKSWLSRLHTRALDRLKERLHEDLMQCELRSLAR